MKVAFITGNKGKASMMQRFVAPYGIEVEQVILNLKELQASTVEEVVSAKAEQAFAELRVPCVVQDGGLFVEALGGFPGPLTKYVLETIGPRGIVKLMEGESNRRAAFKDAVAYCDNEGGVHTFVTSHRVGTISEYVDKNDCKDAWSDAWRIFIPQGQKKPLTGLSQELREEVFREWEKTSDFTQLADWLCKQEVTDTL